LTHVLESGVGRVYFSAVGNLPLRTGLMPDYRLYLLDRDTGHINGVADFQSADDVEALVLANQRGDVVPTELWCGARKVARIDAPPEHVLASRARRSEAASF
jgi:hypothetical protein